MKGLVVILLTAAAWCITARAGNGTALAADAHHQRDTLRSLIPASTGRNGWVMTDSTHVYGQNALYDYCDGGADLFLEYGFRRVGVAEYRKKACGPITLEVYEMQDPAAAFGIFSVRSGQEATRIEIGQGGCVHPYYIMFWNGRFYASITASDSTKECRRGLEAIGRATDRKIKGPTQKPLRTQLPVRKGLSREQFFRGPLAFSSTRVLDLVELFPVIDGVIGTYADHTVIITCYENAAEASRRLAQIKVRFTDDASFSNFREVDKVLFATDRKDRTVCVGLRGSYIVTAISSSADVATTSHNETVRGLDGK